MKKDHLPLLSSVCSILDFIVKLRICIMYKVMIFLLGNDSRMKAKIQQEKGNPLSSCSCKIINMFRCLKNSKIVVFIVIIRKLEHLILV